MTSSTDGLQWCLEYWWEEREVWKEGGEGVGGGGVEGEPEGVGVG